jgi:hypothetical protein
VHGLRRGRRAEGQKFRQRGIHHVERRKAQRRLPDFSQQIERSRFCGKGGEERAFGFGHGKRLEI